MRGDIIALSLSLVACASGGKASEAHSQPRDSYALCVLLLERFYFLVVVAAAAAVVVVVLVVARMESLLSRTKTPLFQPIGRAMGFFTASASKDHSATPAS